MQLKNLQALMEQKLQNDEFDSYAVYVKVGENEYTLCSENVNEDTYFDIASCGKVFVTTPLILQSVDKGLLSLDSEPMGKDWCNVHFRCWMALRCVSRLPNIIRHPVGCYNVLMLQPIDPIPYAFRRILCMGFVPMWLLKRIRLLFLHIISIWCNKEFCRSLLQKKLIYIEVHGKYNILRLRIF